MSMLFFDGIYKVMIVSLQTILLKKVLFLLILVLLKVNQSGNICPQRKFMSRSSSGLGLSPFT